MNNTPLPDSPIRVAFMRDELRNYIRTLSVTQSTGNVSPEFQAGYRTALSHMAGLLGLEAPANFVAPTIEVLR